MKERIEVTAETLTHKVDFDSPFRVNEDGTISRGIGIYAPEQIMGDEIDDKDRKKLVYDFPGYPQWELISGFSGQDSYAGPVMHNSEYLGGGMAEYVLENPGVYCLLAVSWDPEEDQDAPLCGECERHHCASESCPEDYIEGWVLARLKKDA